MYSLSLPSTSQMINKITKRSYSKFFTTTALTLYFVLLWGNYVSVRSSAMESIKTRMMRTHSNHSKRNLLRGNGNNQQSADHTLSQNQPLLSFVNNITTTSDIVRRSLELVPSLQPLQHLSSSSLSSSNIDQSSGNNNQHHHHSITHHTEPAYCHREWPRLELYLPLGLHSSKPEKIHAWKNVMMRSLLLYWPIEKSNTSLMFIIDEEMENTTRFHDVFYNPLMEIRKNYSSSPYAVIRKQFPSVSYRFHQHTNRLAWNKTTNQVNYALLPYVSGYGRQQYLGFVADLYSDAPYIGMLDDDTQFVTFIDREDLFLDEQDGLGLKPLVRGQLKIVGDFYLRWMKANYIIMQREMPMNCMSYFPVVIKREHFAALRQHLMTLHHQPDWDSVFKNVFPHNYNDGGFSQFCVICTYLFWFHRHEYAWRLIDKEPWWDGNSNPRPPNGHYGDKNLYTTEERRLRPFIASHAFYRDPARVLVMNCESFRLPNKRCLDAMSAVYLQGVCSNPAFGHVYGYSSNSSVTTTDTGSTSFHTLSMLNCSVFFEHHEYNSEVFGFEGVQYDDLVLPANRSDILVVYRERLARFHGCDVSYSKYEVHSIISNSNYTQSDVDRLLAMNLHA